MQPAGCGRIIRQRKAIPSMAVRQFIALMTGTEP